jgi:uncharacterized protein with GYD domain
MVVNPILIVSFFTRAVVFFRACFLPLYYILFLHLENFIFSRRRKTISRVTYKKKTMSPPAAFVRRASRLLACSSSSSSLTPTTHIAAAGAFNNNNNDIKKREFKTSSSSSVDLGAEAEELGFAPNPKHNQTFAPSDPIFMSQFVYHADFIKSQMKECSSSASMGEKECARMLAQIGGKMRCYYKATTGEFDGLVIYSFPKNHDVHTFEQIVKSSGLIGKMYTTKLMTSEDANTALKAAKDLVDKYGGGGL